MLPALLPYTIARILENHRAVIERDDASYDEGGARLASDWREIATVKCLFYFRKQSSRGPAREIAAPQRSITISDGGLILPPGTDITDRDRISKILAPHNDEVLYEGPFSAQAVFIYPSHVEVSWIDP